MSSGSLTPPTRRRRARTPNAAGPPRSPRVPRAPRPPVRPGPPTGSSRRSRRRRWPVLIPLLLAAAAAGYAALRLYDDNWANRLAPGIRIAGVDVGGLTTSEARDRLATTLVASYSRPVVVSDGQLRFTLGPRAARVHIALDAMIATALARGRSGGLLTRTWHHLNGQRIDANIRLRLRYSTAAVNRLASRVVHAIDKPAVSAHLSYSATGIGTVPGSPGRKVDARRLIDQLDAAVTNPRAVHALNPVVRPLAAPVSSSAQLAQRTGPVIIVDRAHFALRLFNHLRAVRSYKIAVGRQGLETPAGLYSIQEKQVNPSWHVPNSAWAGSLAGQVIPPGPSDPIKARWMGFAGGAGIHGTTELSSLGTAASHGCIRMAIPDVIALFKQVSVGTPVYVA